MNQEPEGAELEAGDPPKREPREPLGNSTPPNPPPPPGPAPTPAGDPPDDEPPAPRQEPVERLPDSRWSSAGLLLDASAGLRFELLPNWLDGATSSDTPFATLSDAGRYSRVVLGRVVSAGGTTLRDVALKIQKDSYQDEDSVITNPYVCDLWRREYSSLSQFYDEHADSGSRHGVVQLLDLFGRPDRSAEPQQFAPVIFSRRHNVYFHPPCPKCGELLRDCRDHELLQRVDSELGGQETRIGLYDTSCQRYLACPSCSREVSSLDEIRLYVRAFPAGSRPEDYKGYVHDRRQLYRDLAEAFRNKVLTEEQLPFLKEDPRAFEGVDADAMFEPLSFYDFYALPLDCLHLQYHHAIQLVGGRSFDDYVHEEKRDIRFTSAGEYVIEQIRPRLERSRLLIFESPDTEQHGLEVLKVKLHLFRGLCRGIMSVHEHCGPHLDLKPENIMVKVPPGEGDVPSLWTLETNVIDLASSRPFFHGSSRHSDQLIFDRPINFTDTYTSPVIADQKNFRYRRQADLELVALDRSADETIWELKATLSSPKIDAMRYSRYDAITVKIELGGEEADILFRRTGHTGANINRLELQSEALDLSDNAREHLERLVAREALIKNVDFWTFKCFHVPCDLYSLGILLLQTLLETSKREDRSGEATLLRGQSIVEVQRAAGQFADAMERWAHDRIARFGSVSDAEVREHCKTELTKVEKAWTLKDRDEQLREVAPWCSRENIFYDPSPAWWASSRGIPQELFQDCLVIVMRLITSIPGFSYCSDNSDFDHDAPHLKVMQVLNDIEKLCVRVHSSLFGYQATGKYVHEALDELVGPPSDEPAVALGSEVQAIALNAARLLAKDIAKLESDGQLTPEARTEHVHDLVSRTLATLEKPAMKEVFADYLRERFPYVDADIKHENLRLVRERDELRKLLADLLGVSNVDDVEPQRLEQLAQVAALCGWLVEVIDGAPKEMNNAIQHAILSGEPLQNDQRDGRLRDLLQSWAVGEDRDLLGEARQILADKNVGKRLVFAYTRAVNQGIVSLLEALPNPSRFGFDAKSRAALLALKNASPSDLEHRHFAPYFDEGFNNAPSQMLRDDTT